MRRGAPAAGTSVAGCGGRQRTATRTIARGHGEDGDGDTSGVMAPARVGAPFINSTAIGPFRCLVRERIRQNIKEEAHR